MTYRWQRSEEDEQQLSDLSTKSDVHAGPSDASLVEISAEIVSAYVANNALSVADLPKLLQEVYGTLKTLGTPVVVDEKVELRPAVPPKKSVLPDYIICLEDGQKFKSLKRHLRTHYDLSPEEYREKWGLPSDYPMVAPNYSATRSRLAKDSGLGRKAAVVPLRRTRAKA